MRPMKVVSRRFMQAKGCYELRFSDGSRFWASAELVEELGEEPAAARMRLLAAESAYLQARDYALRALGRHELFERELSDRLRERQVDRAAIQRVVAELKCEGYLDDERAGRDFARAKAGSRLVGPHRIVSELRKRGIAADRARELVAEVCPPDYEETCLARFVERQGGSYRRKLAQELERVLANQDRIKRMGGRAGAEFHLQSKYLGTIHAKLISAGFTSSAASGAARRIVFGE